MNRRAALLAAGFAGAVATVVAAGVAAEKRAVARLRSRAADPAIISEPIPGRPAHVHTTDGLRLYAEVDDAPPGVDGGSAPYPFTTIFAHGYALTHETWRFQRAEFRRHGRVVTYDQRSHGRSDRAPDNACTVEACGADLAAVIEQLVPTGKVLLIGHSMGGMSIMSMAQQRPALFAERVAGVVLAATSAGGLGPFEFGLTGKAARYVSHLIPRIVAAAVHLPAVAARPLVIGSDSLMLLASHFAFASEVPGERVQLVARMFETTPLNVIDDFYPTFALHDGFDGLAVMHEIPVQIIGAAQDRITPVEHARAIADTLPNARYVEFDPSGHLVMLEHPDEVTQSLLGLANRVAESRPSPGSFSTFQSAASAQRTDASLSPQEQEMPA